MNVDQWISELKAATPEQEYAALLRLHEYGAGRQILGPWERDDVPGILGSAKDRERWVRYDFVGEKIATIKPYVSRTEERRVYRETIITAYLSIEDGESISGSFPQAHAAFTRADELLAERGYRLVGAHPAEYAPPLPPERPPVPALEIVPPPEQPAAPVAPRAMPLPSQGRRHRSNVPPPQFRVIENERVEKGVPDGKDAG